MNKRQRKVAFLVFIIVVLISLGMYLPREIGFRLSMWGRHIHPGCARIERMLYLAKHPTGKEVLDILGPPIHIHDCGTKDPIPYKTEDMWKSPYWGYGWKEYEMPAIIDFGKDGTVLGIRYGWV
ncbi:MAG: hypothetical protein ACYDCO_09345 [Armatimonadota bacterium]